MIRWLRVVLPPGWALFLAAFVYVGILASMSILEWLKGVLLFSTLASEITAPFSAILAAGYAIHRICVFHPGLRPGYFDWLCGTPWNSKKHLPLGPIHLVWQDVVVVGLSMAVIWPISGWRCLNVLQVFLVVYLLGLAFVLHLTGEKLWSFALVFGVGWLVLFRSSPEIFYPIAAVCYGMALEALRRSMSRFPWDDTSSVRDFHQFLRRSLEPRRKSQASLGWPYERMGPEFSNFAAASLVSWRDVLFMGLLAGWAFYVMEVSFRRIGPISAGMEHITYLGDYMLYCMALMFVVAGRLAVYCDGYLPPLSLLGRLAHLRPIIPGYDRVFVAPILAMVVAAAAWYVPAWTGADTIIVIALAIAADWWLLFGLGPSLKSWRLTGNHRITRSIFQKDLVRTG